MTVDDRVRAALEERARALARPADDVRAAAPRLSVLRFRAGAEAFAIETRFVSEVIAHARWTPLPATPALLAGVLARHGEPLVVFDVVALLGAGPPSVGAEGAVVVLVDPEGRHPELGLRADSLDDVEDVDHEALLEQPPGPATAGHVRGVLADACTVLDGRRILADPALVIGGGGTTGAQEGPK